MLIVSNYHYIREDFGSKYPSIFGVTPDYFREQLEELARYGTFISLNEILELRGQNFNNNYILITFDDGLKEQYDLAKPILDLMGIPAIFFVNTSNYAEKKVSMVHKIHMLRSKIPSKEILHELMSQGNTTLSEKEKTLATLHYNYDDPETATLKYLLNFKLSLSEQQTLISPLFGAVYDEEKVNGQLYFKEEMLQDLHSQGYLGSHSHNHVPLGQISSEELQNELQNSQEFFLRKFGKRSQAMSYPYGSQEASRGISAAVKNAGYELGFTMERAANESLEEDTLLISRFDCNDLPLGKNDLFKGQHLFDNPTLRKWHKDESSFTHKR